MAARERADLLLVTRGLAESRQRAQALILAGKVYSGTARVDKPGTRLDLSSPLEVREGLPFVGRGGLKLAAALDAFHIRPAGFKCLDVGASTGGFTDCLLQRGAAVVYAVDVGYGQLDWRLRNDPRVVVLERTNFRTVGIDLLPRDFDLAVADVSFISLTLILPSLVRFLRRGAAAVVLVKPQFEAGPERVGKGGIVRDPETRSRAVRKVVDEARTLGLVERGIIESPITGADGNVEYLVRFDFPG